MTEDEIDRKLRTEPICRGCGINKGQASPLCWNCFKHRTDVTPFKYADHFTMLQWLTEVGAKVDDLQGATP